jgi:hypothetical protein
VGTRYLPRITAEHHESFIRLVHGYPSYSYDKWLQFRAQEIADWESEGGEVILVDISPDEFTRYCRDTGASRDLHSLRAIAAAKGVGKFK